MCVIRIPKAPTLSPHSSVAPKMSLSRQKKSTAEMEDMEFSERAAVARILHLGGMRAFAETM